MKNTSPTDMKWIGFDKKGNMNRQSFCFDLFEHVFFYGSLLSNITMTGFRMKSGQVKVILRCISFHRWNFVCVHQQQCNTTQSNKVSLIYIFQLQQSIFSVPVNHSSLVFHLVVVHSSQLILTACIWRSRKGKGCLNKKRKRTSEFSI